MRDHLREKGFTLIELLIAIFLGMLVLAAGYTVMQSSNRATREQDLDNRMQDNARVAMDVLSRHFRRAGFLVNYNAYPLVGGVTRWPVDGQTQKIVPVNSAAAADAVTIVSATSTTIAALQQSANSGTSTLFLTAWSNDIVANSVIGVGLTYSGIVLNTNAVARTVQLNTTVPTGALNMNYPGVFLQGGVILNPQQEAAGIRLITATQYRINTAQNAAHPFLEQVTRLTTPQPVVEPIAEDIEDLQIAYGVDTNNNRIIEAGEWVNQPTVNQIDRIRLVRITIVARTAQPDPDLRGAAKAQTVPAIEDRPARANLADGYRRFTLTRIVKTRNIDAVFTL